MKWLIVGIVIITAFCLVFGVWQPFTAGERRWVTYTGVITEFVVDCEECCHPSSYFRINTSDGIKTEGIGDCDKTLNCLIEVGKVYTIRLEPYAEPSALTHPFGETNAWWSVKIDWIKDANDNVIYGNDWF